LISIFSFCCWRAPAKIFFYFFFLTYPPFFLFPCLPAVLGSFAIVSPRQVPISPPLYGSFRMFFFGRKAILRPLCFTSPSFFFPCPARPGFFSWPLNTFLNHAPPSEKPALQSDSPSFFSPLAVRSCPAKPSTSLSFLHLRNPRFVFPDRLLKGTFQNYGPCAKSAFTPPQEIFPPFLDIPFFFPFGAPKCVSVEFPFPHVSYGLTPLRGWPARGRYAFLQGLRTPWCFPIPPGGSSNGGSFSPSCVRHTF